MEPLVWVLIGSVLEPVWIVALKRYNLTKSYLWLVVSVVFMILSPLCLAFAMEGMSVGIAYSIWTGLGSVFALVAGAVLYDERFDRLKVLFIFMIIAGIVGLHLSSGVSA